MAVILCLWIIENLLKNGNRKQKNHEKTKLETLPLINIKNDKAELLLWIFFGICFISAILSIFTHPDWSFGIIAFSAKGMKFLFLNSIVVYYTTRYLVRNEKRNFKLILYITIFASAISSLYAMLQYADIDPFWAKGMVSFGSRSVSTFGNPNFMASFLLLAIILLIGLFMIEKNRFRKFLFFIILLANIAALIITKTRSTWMGLGIGIILILIIFVKYNPGVFKKVAISILIILVISLIPLRSGKERTIFSVVTSRLRSTLDFKSQAYVQRVLIWRSAIDVFTDYPILGCGWGSFEIFYPFYQSKYLTEERYSKFRTHANNVHNMFLEVLSQVGLIGFVVFITFLYFLIRKLYTNCMAMKDEMRFISLSIFFGLIGFFIDNLLNVTLFFTIPALFFWTYCGLISEPLDAGKKGKNG